ncbi:hypothetical protein [Empedobacter sp.]|uniref:hypothetical protein n=1 Tax=Empedobacter sp. TaxID=1927715 RepID=UPI00289CD667|nr:hypothetical protein [Empedobacter sp.]
MNNLDAIYDFILKELRKLTIKENFYFKPIKPKLSDLELIAINISAEYLSIDSEYQLFRYLSNSKLKGMIERSVFNRRKRKLFLHLENIRKLMVAKFNEMETTFIVDSMPLEICKNARANRSKICKENEFSFPSKGRKSRKRIETLFSQLCDQFKIRNNYAKSFNGFKTRVLSKITALTFNQFVNVFVFKRSLNKLKINLC